MSSANNGGNAPPNWMGLLQWSLQYQDGTQETKHTPLSVEKREYLEKVFGEMTVNEPERLLVISNKILQYVGENKLHVKKQLQDVFDSRAELVSGGVTTAEEDLEDLLEECEDIVSQIDMADAFVTKYKGLDHLFVILLNQRPSTTGSTTTSKATAEDLETETNSHNYSVRTKVAGIISLLAQNNEKVQSEMFAASVDINDSGDSVSSLELLLRVYQELSLVSNDKQRIQRLKLCSKIIYAISGLMSYVPFQKQLFAIGTTTTVAAASADAVADGSGTGFGLSQLLLHAVNSEYLPLVQRATVLAESLVGRYKSNRDLADMSASERTSAPAVSSVGGMLGEHKVKISLDDGAGGTTEAPYQSLAQIHSANADAISDDNLLLLSAIFVPTAMKYLNYSIDIEKQHVDSMAARTDLCECSLRLLYTLSSTKHGKTILHAYSTEESVSNGVADNGACTGTGAINSVVVNCLLASLKQHQLAYSLATEPATANVYPHINSEQLTSETELLKKIVYNILTPQ